MTAVLYFDLASPYAYLAVARIERVLQGTKLQPVLLGAIFGLRGFGSWANTEKREQEMAEVERRAAAYGLPPLTWHPDWPANSLQAQRIAIWAGHQGGLRAYVDAVYARGFARGEDISDPEVLRDAVQDAGLDPRAALAAAQHPAIKAELRERTDAAWATGVRGVPTLAVGGSLYYGDDRLEEAAFTTRR